MVKSNYVTFICQSIVLKYNFEVFVVYTDWYFNSKNRGGQKFGIIKKPVTGPRPQEIDSANSAKNEHNKTKQSSITRHMLSMQG